MNIQKYSGAGNKFIIADNLKGIITDRRSEVLSLIENSGKDMDGVIFVENSDSADFRMNYFNKDGTGDALCGNGLRCTARYIRDNSLSAKETLTLEAVSNTFECTYLENGMIRVTFPPPVMAKFNFKLKVNFEKWWELLNCSFVDVGSPHIVVFIDEIEKPRVKDLSEVRIIDWGRNIRMHRDLMPHGANVNFVQVDDAAEGRLSIRSYERGVEGETLACGTGAISSAIVYHALRNGKLPVFLRTMSGEDLIVDFESEERRIRKVHMAGSAERV